MGYLLWFHNLLNFTLADTGYVVVLFAYVVIADSNFCLLTNNKRSDYVF